jgi:hypothetical protein
MIQFKEEKKPGLLGITLVITEVSLEPEPFEVRADSGGVKFQGTSMRFTEATDLSTFAAQIDKAWKFYKQTCKKVTNMAGH